MSAGAPLPPSSSAPASAGAGVVVRVCGRTDVGRTREHNEDAFLVADLAADTALPFPGDAHGGRSGDVQEVRVGPQGMLFVVADGLGGAAAGELASHMAVEGMLRELRPRLGPEQKEPLPFALALRDAALATNAAIHQHAVADDVGAATRSTSRRSATAAPTSSATAWRGRSRRTNR